jgi:hypothetical protein
MRSAPPSPRDPEVPPPADEPPGDEPAPPAAAPPKPDPDEPEALLVPDETVEDVDEVSSPLHRTRAIATSAAPIDPHRAVQLRSMMLA